QALPGFAARGPFEEMEKPRTPHFGELFKIVCGELAAGFFPPPFTFFLLESKVLSCTVTAIMRFSSFVALIPLLPPVLPLDKPLDIKVTEEVECERKTKAGDMIHVHSRGTLAESGNEFDASYNRG